MTYFNTKSMATKFTFSLWRRNFHHNGNHPNDTQQNGQVALLNISSLTVTLLR